MASRSSWSGRAGPAACRRRPDRRQRRRSSWPACPTGGPSAPARPAVAGCFPPRSWPRRKQREACDWRHVVGAMCCSTRDKRLEVDQHTPRLMQRHCGPMTCGRFSRRADRLDEPGDRLGRRRHRRFLRTPKADQRPRHVHQPREGASSQQPATRSATEPPPHAQRRYRQRKPTRTCRRPVVQPTAHCKEDRRDRDRRHRQHTHPRDFRCPIAQCHRQSQAYCDYSQMHGAVQVGRPLPYSAVKPPMLATGRPQHRRRPTRPEPAPPRRWPHVTQRATMRDRLHHEQLTDRVADRIRRRWNRHRLRYGFRCRPIGWFVGDHSSATTSS